MTSQWVARSAVIVASATGPRMVLCAIATAGVALPSLPQVQPHDSLERLCVEGYSSVTEFQSSRTAVFQSSSIPEYLFRHSILHQFQNSRFAINPSQFHHSRTALASLISGPFQHSRISTLPHPYCHPANNSRTPDSVEVH